MPSEHDVAFARLGRTPIDALRRWAQMRSIAPGEVLLLSDVDGKAVQSASNTIGVSSFLAEW